MNHMNTSIFKAYDIRGIYPTDVNKDVAHKVAEVTAYLFEAGEIIIAHDARHGSPELAEAVSHALTGASSKIGKKITVREIGLSSTPMFYFLVNHFKASGGIMITASHNPKNYNGMKVVKSGAEMVPGTEILDLIRKHNLI
jgi:phosphomannomutase